MFLIFQSFREEKKLESMYNSYTQKVHLLYSYRTPCIMGHIYTKLKKKSIYQIKIF